MLQVYATQSKPDIGRVKDGNMMIPINHKQEEARHVFEYFMSLDITLKMSQASI